MKKNVIVTGGSRGIGAKAATLAAEKGYDVCISYNQNENKAHDVVDGIRAKGGHAIAVKADVRKEEEVVSLFEQAENKLGPITALVNNAGLIGPGCLVSDVSMDHLRTVFETNVYGSILCAREAIRRMSTKHGGSGGVIVNVSSLAAFTGCPNEFVHYAASKGAIESFTKGVALEVIGEKIRVNAVAPGLIDTEIHAVSGYPDRVEKFGSKVPIGREGRPIEVAKVILWLLSDESSYIVGDSIRIAGGR